MSIFSAPSNAVAGLAAEEEKARQQGILKAAGGINDAFDSNSRQQQYTDYGNTLKNYYNQDLTRQHDIAARTLKFALARGGNTGGSLAVDKGRMLGDEYAAGVLNSTRAARQGMDSLRGQDEASRSQLLGMTQSGLSSGAGPALSSALITNRAAQANLLPQGLGDVFSGIGDYANKEQTRNDQMSAYNKALYG